MVLNIDSTLESPGGLLKKSNKNNNNKKQIHRVLPKVIALEYLDIKVKRLYSFKKAVEVIPTHNVGPEPFQSLHFSLSRVSTQVPFFSLKRK